MPCSGVRYEGGIELVFTAWRPPPLCDSWNCSTPTGRPRSVLTSGASHASANP